MKNKIANFVLDLIIFIGISVLLIGCVVLYLNVSFEEFCMITSAATGMLVSLVLWLLFLSRVQNDWLKIITHGEEQKIIEMMMKKIEDEESEK